MVPFFLMLNGAGMSRVSVRINSHGGYYRDGMGFDITKWLEMMAVYKTEMDITGGCPIDNLAKL
jgi:hypothetical protein